jgi:hypothetical protein
MGMTESEEDELARLIDAQEETVHRAREWVQVMVAEAHRCDLHLQMTALEMMAHGLGILTGKEVETARADVMRMFDDVVGEGHLVLRRITLQARPETPADASTEEPTRNGTAWS